MRFPIGIVLVAAGVGLAVMLIVGQFLLQPDAALILEAGFDREQITPNADGDNDAAIFRYRLSRSASVTLGLVDEAGTRYSFRTDQLRGPGDYEVIFSGIVDGYTRPDESDLGIVERRLIPDGRYTWTLSAVEQETAGAEEATGTLMIQDADVPLPLITSFTVSPAVFTPNQDSIDDRVEINVYLEKEADLKVYLVGENGAQIPISARKEGRLEGEIGRHIFDYEGGIDLGADPPPDGTYTVVALAQDAEGQRVRRESILTIQQGGKPFAEIVPQAVGADVVFEVQPFEERFANTDGQTGELIPIPNNPAALAYSPLTTLQVGEMLVFKLTIENYSDVPLRTTGPHPGTVYEQNQLAAALGYADESGAWRVGIECHNSTSSYPWRWAIGTDEDLEEVTDPETGETYRYLPAGKRAVVWGAIHMTEIEARNPQDCWAGLIHEDVEVNIRNSNVGRRAVRLVESGIEAESE